jgi:hypothetical protein
MKKMAKSLADSARYTVEAEFGALLDDIFDGDEYTTHDGNAICSSHTLTVGSSYSNYASVATDLGIGALRAASERMERTPTERGFPANIGRGSVILCTPTYQWIAQEIIKSEQKPYTADNEMNAFSNMGLSYFVSHYMGDDDMWLLLSEKQYRDIKLFWRQKPIFENSDDFDTKDAKFSGYMRLSLGATDWRGVDGSSGA